MWNYQIWTYPGQLFQLHARILQTLSLHVIVRCVRQQLVQGDDVTGHLIFLN